MVRKGFNWRARQVKDTIVDNTETKNISLDLKLNDGNYDNCNELVLPSKKRKTKTKEKDVKIVKILSKKHRKRLEKILDKKAKKENRSTLLEELKKVQLSEEERKNLQTLASVQTKGLKRLKIPEKKREIREISSEDEEVGEEIEVKRLKVEDNPEINTEKKVELNVLGLDQSSDEEDVEDEVKTEEIPIKLIEEPKEIPVKVIEKPREVPVGKTLKKPTFVPVHRTRKIREIREKLPIISMEQEIIEMISANTIVIISGETGSGKTTQIPQFLYEAGYCNSNRRICVTEPRRIAAISMSRRVAEEMSLTEDVVSFLVRFEGNFNEEKTRILFVTDGVLLKEIKSDFLLKNYSVVILDEAHERSMFTDILIGLLSRIVKLREKKGDPLKLIIMSATLKLEDFTENRRLFKQPPPSLKIETRQFPVTIHFNKVTYDNYLEECLKKIIKIHKTLPEGGILCFVTGQQEVNYLVRKLRQKFPLVQGQVAKPRQQKLNFNESKIRLPDIKLDDYSLPNDSEIFAEQDEVLEEKEKEEEEEEEFCGQPLWTLPLYSLLPVDKQQRIFQKIPEGSRLCVISTNVAETSLTIPGIKYVVDSGKTKTKFYDKITGVSGYDVTWTSKASADQRAGRAGRSGPGHCYRLYSSAVFNDIFEQFPEPEIRRAPSDDLYLRMRSMNIEKIINFPFPTAPDLLQLKTAENRLKILEILDENSRITALGKAVVKFPVLPRFGKMLALSHQYDILQYTICLVAALSVPEILIENPGNAGGDPGKIREKWTQTRLRWAGSGNSYLLGDNMVLLKAVGAAEYAKSQGKLEEFCTENGIRVKALKEVEKLRSQLSKEIVANVEGVEPLKPQQQQLDPPDDLKAKLLRQILLAGLGDQIARKVGIDEVPSGEKKSHYKYAYRANNMEDLVFLHRYSVLRNSLPEFVIYQELYEIETENSRKIFMRGITAIEPEWLPIYVKKSCSLSAPLDKPEPWLSKDGEVMCAVKGTYGQQAWPLSIVKIAYPKCENLYKFFAKFLLEGQVFDDLKKYQDVLLSRPCVMTKNWAKLQQRTRNLLKKLYENDVKSRLDLKEMWRENPKFLLEEYLDWLPQSAHSEIMTKWPPLS